MFKPSTYINDICPSCHPRDYVKTLSKFTGEYEQESDEYLYECVKCGARVWIGEQWIKNNAVAVEVEQAAHAFKTGGNEEMTEKNMVLVNVKELEEISLVLAESLGEDNPLVLTVDAMEDLEKVIEKSTVHPVIDDAALRGIAEVLDTALNSCGPYSTTRTFGASVGEEISREEMLELIMEDAIKGIYELAGDGEGLKQ